MTLKPAGWIDDQFYQRIHRLMPVLNVDLFIMKGPFLLLGKRVQEPDKGKWWIPGGRLMRAENPRDAVVRIARKELAMDLKPGRLMGIGNLFFDEDPFDHGCGTHTFSLCYEALMHESQEPESADKAHEKFMWLDISNYTVPVPAYVQELISSYQQDRFVSYHTPKLSL